MAERQFGPYKLVRQIAVGGMAEIHLAKTAGLAGFEKYVALKMIHPNFAEDEQFIQMLVDEAKIAVQLTHGNIAQTFDLGRVGDTYYITMEYIDGADLYKLLRRGSEVDLEMPLDVCAFVGKEVASALDYAHRKKDVAGKPLGIVHRDVSPQNVLVSYAGEVKLVDFGIAKATSKAKQTAIGVIKGKYYYMSPEQAWGDPIDYRSDIFSAGIVLYEMITGQMLYLEEDLHKLLDMARKADIAPPSKLRKGIPPQLERIVMHALAKVPGERYQSAGDFANDLERFLHAYSPVFTGAKLSTLLRQVVGDPMQIPDDKPYEGLEVRSGPQSTHPLPAESVVHNKEDIRDENSVIFRVNELQGKPPDPPQPKKPASRPPQNKQSAPRVTRAADPLPDTNPPPVVAPPRPRPSTGKVRQVHDSTRSMPAAPPGPSEQSGLLELQPAQSPWTDDVGTHDDELENVGERTVITKAPTGESFETDATGEQTNYSGHGDATMISVAPRPDTDEGETRAADPIDEDDEDMPTLTPGMPDEDGPTIQRDFRDVPPAKPAVKKAPKGAPPPALAAKIHSPAVSELRKPRPSRKTPPGGQQAVQPPSVLQAIVGAQTSEPMPAPRPPPRPATPPAGAPQPPPRPQTPAVGQPQLPLAPPPPQPIPPQMAPTIPPGSITPPEPVTSPMNPAMGQMPMMNPSQSNPQFAAYGTNPPPYNGYQPYYDPNQPHMGLSTPPPGFPVQAVPGVPPHMQPYAQMYPQQQPYPSYPPMTPGAMYAHQQQPFGPTPTPPTLTGALRLSEGDELPPAYNLSGGRSWGKLIIVGFLAVAVAAGVTLLVLHQQAASPSTGQFRVVSEPPNAEITYDGNRLTDKTPFTIDAVPSGTRHEIEITLAHYQKEVRTIDLPKVGGEIEVSVVMTPIRGKLRILSTPDGAEIRIDGQLRGKTPITIDDVDMSAKKIELRLAGYQPYIQDLVWPANNKIDIDAKLQR